MEDSVTHRHRNSQGWKCFGKLGTGWGESKRAMCTCHPAYSHPDPPSSQESNLSPQPSQAPFHWKLHRAACNNLSWLFPGRSLCCPTLSLPFPTPECFFQGCLWLFQNLSRLSVSHEASRLQPSVHLSWSRVVFSNSGCYTGHWVWGLVGFFSPIRLVFFFFAWIQIY